MRASIGLALLLLSAPAYAQPSVFAGDPVEPGSGRPFSILPGAPLVYPGVDGAFGTQDDVVDFQVRGDVDVVVRSGATYTPGEAIPPPNASAASAPGVVAGGVRIGIGDEVPFQVILSDGLPPALAGNPLVDSDLDDRGTLVFAYGDLDGDGFIGPRTADGDEDVELERQEVLAPIGRTLGRIAGGVASGTIATSIGAPPSAGGLGVVLAAGVATGSNPFLFEDGPWISTMAPAMFPLAQAQIIGGEPGQVPDPIGIVDLELEEESIYLPAPDDPTLGSIYAIPLDGSEVTVDLLRSESAAASRVAFAEPLSLAAFRASAQRRVLPAVDETGARALVESVAAIALASDGSATRADLVLMPSDLVGNPADPPPPGETIILQATPSIRIASPDTDLDPSREEITFTTSRFVRIAIDDTGRALTQPSVEWLFALRGGSPVAILRIDLGAGGAVAPLVDARLKVGLSSLSARGQMSVAASFAVDPAADLAAQPLHLRVDGPSLLVDRLLPAGSLVPSRGGRVLRFHDPKSASGPRIARLALVRSRRDPAHSEIRVTIARLDTSALSPATSALRLELEVDGVAHAADLTCTPKRSALTCASVALPAVVR